ncbi:hypothetical protein C922_01372 [Plasmodium inui San Antonio 1]|uniref:C3H1-type domain-containing protein n=1 Tax=Plasmodium inui San Antonio 1 TaxID=1237626 RepID=W7A5F4_9APIC|nr:hypothetical protein C922_01372 [Plasmodium inui San Antonio 1]EUD68352.1 hypothetical protein C922_01372 [Plasmodium inui San Antonio 1]
MECLSHDSPSTNGGICSKELTNSSGNSKSIEMHAYKSKVEKGPNCEQNGLAAIRTSNRKNEERKNQMNYCTDNDQGDNFKVLHTYSGTSQKSRKNGRTKNFSKNKADFNDFFYEEKDANSSYVEKSKRPNRHFPHGGSGSNRGFNDNRLRKGTSSGNCSSGNNNIGVHNPIESFGKNYSGSRMNVVNGADEKYAKRVATNNENLVPTANKSHLDMVYSRNRRRGANSEKQPFVFTNRRGQTGSYNDPNGTILECDNDDDHGAAEHLGVGGIMCGDLCGDVIDGESNCLKGDFLNDGIPPSKKSNFLRKSKSLNRNNIYESKEDDKRLLSITNRDTPEGMDYMNVRKKACSNNELKFKEKRKDEANCTNREANYDFKSALNVQFSKTKMCPYMNTKEKCKRFLSNMCPYAHDQSELKPFPDLYKTAMCRNFMKNLCTKSKIECNFAHNVEELRSTDEFYKTTLCKFFLNGYCKADTNCRHAHGHKELKCKEAKYKDAKCREAKRKEVNCEEMEYKEVNCDGMNCNEIQHRHLGSPSWESDRVGTEKTNNHDGEEQPQHPDHPLQESDMEGEETLLNGETMNGFKSSESFSLSEGKEVRIIREGEDVAEEDMLAAENIQEDEAVMDLIAMEGKHISNTHDREKNDSKNKKEKFYNASRKLMSISTKDTYCFLSNGLSRNMESSENFDDEDRSVRTNEDSTLAHSNGDSKIKSSESANSYFKGDLHPEYPFKSNETMYRMEVKDEEVNHLCDATGREGKKGSDTGQGRNSVDNNEEVTTIGHFAESHNTTDGKQERDNSNKFTYSNSHRDSNVALNGSLGLKKEGRKVFNEDNAYGHRSKVSVGGGKGSNEATIHPKMERNKNGRGYMNPNFAPIGGQGRTRNFQDKMRNGKLNRNMQVDAIKVNDEMCPRSEMHSSRLSEHGMYGYDGAEGYTGSCGGRDSSGYVPERGENYTWEDHAGVNHARENHMREDDVDEYNRSGYRRRGFHNADKGNGSSVSGVIGVTNGGDNFHSGSNNNFNGDFGNSADNYSSSVSKNYGKGKRANGGTTRYNGHPGSRDSSNNGVANRGAANGGFADNVMASGDLANNSMMSYNVVNNNLVNSNLVRKNFRSNHPRNNTRNVRSNARNNLRNGALANYGANTNGANTNGANPNSAYPNSAYPNSAYPNSGYPNDIVENNMHTMHSENVNTCNNNFSCYSPSGSDANVYMNRNNFPYKNVTQGSNFSGVGRALSKIDNTNYGGNYGGHYGNVGSGPLGGNNNPYLPQDYTPPICNNIMNQSKNYRSKKKSVKNNMPYQMSNNGNFQNSSGYDRNGNIYDKSDVKRDGNYNAHGFNPSGTKGSMNNSHVDGNIYGDMFMNNGPRNNHHDSVNNIYTCGNGNNYYPSGYDTSGMHVMNTSLENSPGVRHGGMELSVHSGHMYNTTRVYGIRDGQSGSHDGMQNGAHHGMHRAVQNGTHYDAHNGMKNDTHRAFRQMDKKAHSGNIDHMHGSRNRKCLMSNNAYNDTYKGSDENCSHALNKADEADGANGANLGQPFACDTGVHDEASLGGGSFLCRKPRGCSSNSLKSGHMAEAGKLKRNNYDETNLGSMKSDHIGKRERENRKEGRSGEEGASEMRGTAYCTMFNAKDNTNNSERNAQLQDNNRGNSKECNTRRNRNGSKNGGNNNGVMMRHLHGSTNRSTLRTLAACISPVNGPADQPSLCEDGQVECSTLEKMKPKNYNSTGENFKSNNLKIKSPRRRGSQNRRAQREEHQSRGQHIGKEQIRGKKNQEELHTELQIADHPSKSGMLKKDNKIEKFLIDEEPQTCVSCYQYMTHSTPGEMTPTNTCCLMCGQVIKKSISLMIIELLQPQVQHLLSDANFYVQNYHD